MPGVPSKANWLRVTGTKGSVGTSFAEFDAITVPARGVIRRVRVIKDSGAATTVEFEVREAASGTNLDVVVAYAGTAPPLDSEEQLMYELATSGGDSVGSLFLAAKGDTGTTQFTAQIDIEVLV